MPVYLPRLKDAALANKVFGRVPSLIKRGNPNADVVLVLQQFLNIVAGPEDRLLVEDGLFGKVTEATLKLYQARVKLPSTGEADTATWWALRRDVWGVRAWKPTAKNPHNGQATDFRGIAFEAARLEDAIFYAFGYGFSANYMVERNARGTSTLSDHARSIALDLMTWYLKLHGMEAGWKILNWLASEAAAEYNIRYALFDYHAWYRGKDKAPRLMTKAKLLFVLRKVPAWKLTGKINYDAPDWAHETHVHVSTPVLPDWVAPHRR